MATKKTASKKTPSKKTTKPKAKTPTFATFFATAGRLFNAAEEGRIQKGTYAKIIPGENAGTEYQKIRVGTTAKTIYEGDLVDFVNATFKRAGVPLVLDRMSRGDLPAMQE